MLCISGFFHTPSYANDTLPWLRTSGNRIIRADTNAAVILRGVNIMRSEWSGNMNWENVAVPEIVNKWKGNIIVRGFASIPVNNNDAKYLKLLDDTVALAQTNNIYVALVWRSHEIEGAQPNEPDNRAREALTKLAIRYKGRSNVIYGLQVEPHNTSWSKLRPIFETMVDSIYEASTPYRPLILVPGDNYSKNINGAISDPVKRENVVYTPHGYYKSDEYKSCFGDAYDANLPVFMKELGPDGDVSVSDMPGLLTYLRNRNIGWAAWWLDYSRVTALVNQSDISPTLWGKIIKEEMSDTPAISSMEILGDATSDNLVDLADFVVWRKEFTGSLSSMSSDFSGNGRIDLNDFVIWINEFKKRNIF